MNVEGNPFEGPAETRGYAFPGFVALVREVRPAQATLVPDAAGQLTSDHGFAVGPDGAFATPRASRRSSPRLQDAGCRVSLFVDADVRAVRAAAAVGADRVELYTGPYAHAAARATRPRRSRRAPRPPPRRRRRARPQRRPRPRPRQPRPAPRRRARRGRRARHRRGLHRAGARRRRARARPRPRRSRPTSPCCGRREGWAGTNEPEVETDPPRPHGSRDDARPRMVRHAPGVAPAFHFGARGARAGGRGACGTEDRTGPGHVLLPPRCSKPCSRSAPSPSSRSTRSTARGTRPRWSCAR